MDRAGPDYNYTSLQVLRPSWKNSVRSRWRQYTAGAAASMSMLACGAWFCWPAPLLPHLLGPESPIPMTPEEASWMVSSIEIGTLLSPFPASFFSDRYGRKICLLLSAPFFFISLCLTIFIKTVPSLCLARIIQGFSMGVSFTILPLYLGEIASPEARGTLTSFFQVAWCLGCLFPYCVGPFLSYNIFTLTTFLLTVFFVLCFFGQPETPYYHAMRGNLPETANMLRRLRDSPTDCSIKNELDVVVLEVKNNMEEKTSWKNVFLTPADRKALFLLLSLNVITFLSGENAILTYTTETFSKFPNNFISPDCVTIGIGLVSLLGSITSIFTSDRLGRRFLLLVSSTMCMLSLSITSAYFYLYSYTNKDLSLYSWVAPLAVTIYILFISAGMHPVCVSYTSELFPTETRAVASSISNLCISCCSFLVLKCYEPLTFAMGIYFTYFCFATICLIGVFIFYFMMPETKAKTFLEIRDELGKSQKSKYIEIKGTPN